MGIFDVFKKKDNPTPPPPAEAKPMTRNEVELLLLRVVIRGEEALVIKLYKDGTVVRSGAGGVPAVGVGAVGEQRDRTWWNEVLSSLPDDVFNMNMAQEAPNAKDPFSYTLAMFGESKNGQTGEHAQWARSQGIHVASDLNAQQHPPLIPWLDRLSVHFTSLTNSWYFDVVMLACMGMRSNQFLPAILTSPPTDQGKDAAFSQFLTQFLQGPSRNELSKLPEGKIYTRVSDGATFRMELKNEGFQVNYYFHPAV